MMEKNFNVSNKNYLICEFDEIEKIFAGTFGEALFEGEALREDNVRTLILKLSDFAGKVDEVITSAFSSPGVLYERLMVSKELKEYENAVLNSIMENVFSLMQILDGVIKKEDNCEITELCEMIWGFEGEISQHLRFDIPAAMKMEEESCSVVEACRNLKTLGDANGDYYLADFYFQNSSRKILHRLSASDTAIVLQGPVDKENNFTKETLRRYRRIYPDALIILSTWESDADNDLKWFAETIGIVCLANKMPDDRGKSNIKLQLKSSREGIAFAEKCEDIRYVLKTRTDQRIFLPGFLNLFKNNLKIYPASGEGVKERMVFLGGMNSMCTVPFRLTDFLAFGNVSDLSKLYGCSGDDERLDNFTTQDSESEYYNRVIERSTFDNLEEVFGLSENERIQLSQNMGNELDPEAYMAQGFYEREVIKRKLNFDEDRLIHYWNFLINYVCVVDADQLMLYWNKYDNAFIRPNGIISDGGLTCDVWQELYFTNK